MMNLMLDDETERYLIEILAVEKIPSDRLIKKMLRDRWLTHQPEKTLLERRGGHPEHLLEGPGNLSDREVRKKAIGEYVEQRHQRRLQNREPSKDDRERGWDVFLSLGKDAPEGKLQDASIESVRYLYAKE